MARPKTFDRDTALQKALHTFWAKGYEATSVSDLTEAMGLSRSSLYETFGDKQDLFLEALEHYTDFIGSRRSRMLARAASAKQGIRDYLMGVVAFVNREDYPGGCFITNTAIGLGTLSGRVEAVIKKGFEKQETDFLQCLQHGQKAGEIKPDKDCRDLARYFAGLVRGITVIARIDSNRKALEAIVNVGMKVLD